MFWRWRSWVWSEDWWFVCRECDVVRVGEERLSWWVDSLERLLDEAELVVFSVVGPVDIVTQADVGCCSGWVVEAECFSEVVVVPPVVDWWVVQSVEVVFVVVLYDDDSRHG